MTLCEACVWVAQQLFNGDPYECVPACGSQCGCEIHPVKSKLIQHPLDIPKQIASSINCALCALLTDCVLTLRDHVSESQKERAVELMSSKLVGERLSIRADAHQATRRNPDVLNLNELHALAPRAWRELAEYGIGCRLAVWASPDSPAGVSGDVSCTGPLSMQNSQETFSRIQSWLDMCQSSHWRCKQTMSGLKLDESVHPTLPTRVLDVRPADGPKLVQTLGARGKYVALSYCWGPPDKRPLCTTRANVRSHLTGIPLSALPRTHLDAVTITRALGINYLWVDALCIVQDDKDEWLHESENMGSLYESASLTISASGAVDPTQGCFLSDCSASAVTVELPYFPTATEQAGLIVVAPLPARADPGSGPLRARAWALQEWHLSRRIVHFMPGGLTWKCRSAEFKETGVYTDGGQYSGWAEIIADYSTRKLTHEGDRLLALQGLASKMQRARRDRYCMGVWTDDLPRQLLWKRTQEAPLLNNPDLPGLPSWTWASRLGRFRVLGDQEAPKAKSICRQVKINSSGDLRIKCLAIRCRCSRTAASLDEWGPDIGSVVLKGSIMDADVVKQLCSEWDFTRTGHRPFYDLLHPAPSHSDERRGLAIFDDVAPSKNFLALLLMQSGRAKFGPGREEHLYWALLIQPAPSSTDYAVKYQRIGMGFLWFKPAVLEPSQKPFHIV